LLRVSFFLILINFFYFFFEESLKKREKEEKKKKGQEGKEKGAQFPFPDALTFNLPPAVMESVT